MKYVVIVHHCRTASDKLGYYAFFIKYCNSLKMFLDNVQKIMWGRVATGTLGQSTTVMMTIVQNHSRL